MMDGDFYDRLVDIIDGYKYHGKTSHALDQIDALYADRNMAEVDRLRAEQVIDRQALDRAAADHARLRIEVTDERRRRAECVREAEAERDRLAEQVKRIADEADARAAKTVQDDAYERGQATGLRAVAAAIRAALAGEDPA